MGSGGRVRCADIIQTPGVATVGIKAAAARAQTDAIADELSSGTAELFAVSDPMAAGAIAALAGAGATV